MDALDAIFRFPAPSEVLVSDTSSPSTLSDVDAVARYVRLIGPLTADRTHLFPAIDGADWIVENATTGTRAVTVKTTGGSGVALASGAIALVRCRGVDLAAVSGGSGSSSGGELRVDVTAGDVHITAAQALAVDTIVAYGSSASSRGIYVDTPYTGLAGHAITCLNVSTAPSVGFYAGGDGIELVNGAAGSVVFSSDAGQFIGSGTYQTAASAQPGIITPDGNAAHVLRGDGTFGASPGSGGDPKVPAWDVLGFIDTRGGRSWQGGNYTYGRTFLVCAPGVSVYGVEVINPDTSSRTFKVSIWHGSTRLATATATVAAGARVKIPFSSPFLVTGSDLHQQLKCTAWETSGAGYSNTAGVVGDFPGYPFKDGAVLYLTGGIYASGDATPSSADGGVALTFPYFA